MATNTRDEVVNFILAVTGDKELAATAKAMLAAGDAAETTSAEFDKFAAALKLAASQSAQISKALSQKAALNETTAALKAATEALPKLHTQFGNTEKDLKKLATATTAAEREIAKLTATENKQAAALAKTEGALQKAGIDTKNLAGEYAKLQKAGAESAAALAKIGAAGENAGKGTRNAAGGVAELNKNAQQGGGALGLIADNLGKIVTVAAAVKVALAGIHFASDAIGNASAVEDQLARVQAIAQTTAETFRELGPAIEKAAQDVNVSTTVAAGALGALVQQGQSTNDALIALVPTLRLMKIAQLDAATAAGIVDDALDRFGLGIEDAGKVVDVLVVASKGAKDGLAGIANAMQGIAPLARELNLSFEDTAAILGLLQQNGIDAGNATRGLRSVLSDLQEPTSKLSNNLRNLGDSSGDFKSAIETLATSGQDGRDAILDLEGATRVLVTFLVQQGSGAIDKFRAALDASAGSAEKTTKAINDTAGGAFDALSNSLDLLGQKLAAPLLDPVRVELEKLSAQLNAFLASDAFAQIAADVGKMATDAVAAFDTLLSSIDWPTVVADTQKAVKDIGTSLHTFAEDAGEVADSLKTIADSIGALRNLGTVGVKALETVFAGTAAVVAKSGAAISTALDGVVGDTDNVTAGLNRTGDAAVRLARDSLGDAIDASGDLVVNLKQIAGIENPFENVEAGAESSAEKIGELATEAEGANEQIALLAPTQLTAAQAAEDHAQAMLQARDAARNARAEFARLAQDSTTSADALRRAAKESADADANLAKLSGTLQKGANAAQTYEQAVKLLGKTHAELVDTASQAEQTVLALSRGLAQGKGSIEDVRAAFDLYATALRASTANSDEWAKKATEDTLRVKAGVLGILDAYKGLGAPIPKPDTGNFQRGVEEIGSGVKGVNEGLRDIIHTSNDVFEKLGDQAVTVTSNTTDAIDAMVAWEGTFRSVSTAAGEFFNKMVAGLFNLEVAFDADGTGFTKLGMAINDAARITTERINEQRLAVQSATADYADFSDEAIRAAAGAKGGFDALAESLRGTAANARAGASEFELLGAADLSGLSSALDSAAAKVDALRQKAIDAKEEIASIGDDVQDSIDRIRGNDTAIENRRFEEQIQRLKDLAEESGELNSREFNEAMQRAKELHELNLKQIADEKRARDDANKPTGGGGGGAGGGTDTAPTPTPAPTAPRPGNAITFAPQVLLLGNDPASATQLAKILARDLKKELDDIDGRSR